MLVRLFTSLSSRRKKNSKTHSIEISCTSFLRFRIRTAELPQILELNSKQGADEQEFNRALHFEPGTLEHRITFFDSLQFYSSLSNFCKEHSESLLFYQRSLVALFAIRIKSRNTCQPYKNTKPSKKENKLSKNGRGENELH